MWETTARCWWRDGSINHIAFAHRSSIRCRSRFWSLPMDFFRFEIKRMKILAKALGVSVLLALFGGCSKPTPTTAPDFATPWQTESAYIVQSVTTDLVKMAAFGSQDLKSQIAQIVVDVTPEGSPDRMPLVFNVVVKLPGKPAIKSRLEVHDEIFSADVYRTLMRTLFDHLALAPSGPESSDDNHALLRTLTNPSSEIIAREDNTLSARLTENFLSPIAHEEAALLLSVFALQESSGDYYEIRPELCRITAHQIFAELLRQKHEPSIEGKIATIAFSVLCDNQTHALQQMNQIPDDLSAARAWKLAMRTRVTRDYRLITADHPSLIERLERFRAQAEELEAEIAAKNSGLDDELTSTANWYRILNANSAGVELGHDLAGRCVMAEAIQLSHVYEYSNGKPYLKGKDEVLNTEPEYCIIQSPDQHYEARVVGWSHWAGFCQRHLCHAIQSDFEFLQDHWGVPEKAATYREWVDKTFAKLRLYPFVRRAIATETKYYQSAQKDSMAVVHSTPHLVPILAWNRICYYPRKGCGNIYMPPPHAFLNEWHRINPPPGTAYMVDPRLNQPSLLNRQDYSDVIAKLHESAPYDIVITRFYLKDLAKKKGLREPEFRELEKALSPMADYSTCALSFIVDAAKADKKAYEYWLKKYAEIDVAAYSQLGEFYETENREQEALAAYEKMVECDHDSVRIASRARWLIMYYENHGNGAKADQLANFVEDVYSCWTGSKGVPARIPPPVSPSLADLRENRRTI